jgi:hypothetical protein
VIFEAGPSAGASIENWAHVRMFSPWGFSIDKQAATLLSAQGWVAPAEDVYPTGRELLDDYVYPLTRRAASTVLPHAQRAEIYSVMYDG